ncbi:peptide deformylase [Streptomyces sp. NPDC054871]
MESIGQVQPFTKGTGIAAPQIAVARAAAVVQPAEPDAAPIVLLNPRITAYSDEMDVQYEGCLSFFDVRGLVPRPLRITVETAALDDTTVMARPQTMACARAHRGGDGLPRYRRMVTGGGNARRQV